ncbi:Peptidase_C25_N domain containing protein [Spirosomataceae bacterium]
MRLTLFLFLMSSFGLSGQKSVLSEGEWIKVSVKKSGIYKIDLAFLKKNVANFKSVDPQKIRIFTGTIKALPQVNSTDRIQDLRQIPVKCNDTDRKLDTSDEVLFYGESPHEEYYDTISNKLKHKLNPYSNENFYFINFNKEDALKLETLSSLSSSNPTVSKLTFYNYVEKESKNLLASGREWFGDFFYNTQSYELATPDAESDISVTMNILGVGRSDQTLDLKINNQSVGKYTLARSVYNSTDNLARYNRVSNLTEVSTVIEKNNTINIGLSLSTIGSANAGAYIDFYEYQYERNLKYDPNNPVIFWNLNATDETNYKITQIDQNTEIWNISNPYLPKSLALSANGNFSVTSTNNIDKLLFFNKKTGENPIFIEKVQNQNIVNHTTPNLLVVYPERFKDEVERLIIFKKQTQNVDVLGFSTKEIYNEFSSGKVDPTAIRDLCRHFWLKNKKVFKHLLLIGDATFDYKNNNQITFIDTKNLVPTYQSRESLEPIYSFSSDDYFGFLEDQEGNWAEGFSQRNIWISNRDNDHTMDIAVGRLPAKTLFETKNIINKIINYQSNEVAAGHWKNKITFVADNRDYNIHQQDAEALSKLSKAAYGGFEINKIYLDQYEISKDNTAPKATEASNNAIKNGTFLINYSGHGSEDGWANEKLLTISDIQNLRNPTKLPIFFTATCQFGKFDNPALVSGAELALLNPTGGCIALLTTTRPVYSSTNEIINSAFYKNISKAKTLGELFVLTKNQSLEGEINRNFSLLGDPSQPIPDFTNNIELLKANGSDPIGQTWKALEKIQIIGKTSEPFSGKVRISVFDKTQTVNTLGTFPDGPVFKYQSPNRKIFEGLYHVVNGQFLANIIIPKDQINGTGKGLITFYAVNEDSTTNAHGFFDNFEISSITNAETVDISGPEIKIVQKENQTLTIEIFDENGINNSSFDANHQIQIILNDTIMIYAKPLLTLIEGGFQGVINFFVGSLPSGKHKMKFIVFDSYNNKSEKTFDFNVKKPEFAIVNYINYPNPFSNYTNLIFKHNRTGDEILAYLTVYDAYGRTIVDYQKNCKNCDEKIEFGLDFDSNNNVSNQLYYKLKLLSLAENETTHISGRLIFWK